ncbi:ricin-type beta-trefoil lectin domain protein [Streptomyces violascens]
MPRTPAPALRPARSRRRTGRPPAAPAGDIGQGSRLCLDAYDEGTSSGTRVITWPCNGQTNRQWNVNADGTITGVQSGLCLEAGGANTANGTKLQLWSCSGAANQHWSQQS